MRELPLSGSWAGYAAPTWFSGLHADKTSCTILAVPFSSFYTAMTETLSKEALREQAKFHRNRIEVLPEMGEQAADEFSGFLKELPKDKVLAGYWPKGKEFDIRPVMDDARADRGCG